MNSIPRVNTISVYAGDDVPDFDELTRRFNELRFVDIKYSLCELRDDLYDFVFNIEQEIKSARPEMNESEYENSM